MVLDVFKINSTHQYETSTRIVEIYLVIKKKKKKLTMMVCLKKSLANTVCILLDPLTYIHKAVSLHSMYLKNKCVVEG